MLQILVLLQKPGSNSTQILSSIQHYYRCHHLSEHACDKSNPLSPVSLNQSNRIVSVTTFIMSNPALQTCFGIFSIIAVIVTIAGFHHRDAIMSILLRRFLNPRVECKLLNRQPPSLWRMSGAARTVPSGVNRTKIRYKLHCTYSANNTRK